MAQNKFIPYFIVAMMVLAFGPASLSAKNSGPVTEDEIEILASGPIHEAFAEAVVLDPEPGMEAPKEPPPLIEEMPPDSKPPGDMQWIPGYWAWDDERNDYIWVSGIWRVPPPGRQWAPGYWNRTAAGYQWISGYWGAVADKQVQYLPPPPESVEVGPSSHAPSPDHIWMPGYWTWQHGRYAWRPGYWAPVDPNWIWVPAQYVWTPRGYIFVSGYWDYTVVHRGVLFAPVYFPPRVHLGLAFTFSPGFVIGLHIFDDALFLRPRYRHYYFGDYYAPVYYQRGIYPWFSLHARRLVYDPIFAHQRWHYRHDRLWESRLERTFRQRRDNVSLRPPRTYNRSDRPAATVRPSGSRSVVTPLDRTTNTPGTQRFQPLSEKERSDFTRQEKAVRNYQQERQQRESAIRGSGENRQSVNPLPNRTRTIQSPITDRAPRSRERQNITPPQRYKEPAVNPNIEPLERSKRPVRPQTRTIQPESERYRTDESRRQTINSLPRSSNGNERSPQRRIIPQERTPRVERQR